MLPVSAADLIEFRPAAERVAKARAAFTDAQALEPPNVVALNATETALAEAEAAQAAADPVYKLRVPTERSRAGLMRDVVAEGVLPRGNADLVAAILASADEISPDDADFVRTVQHAMKGADDVPVDDWPRLSLIARTIPAAARIIADRLMYSSVSRIHAIRHHLVVEGQKTPLPERAFEDLARAAPADVVDIGVKIDGLLNLDAVTVKN